MMHIARRLLCCCPAHEAPHEVPHSAAAHEPLLPPAAASPAAVGRPRPTFAPTPPAPGTEVTGPAQVHMAPVSPWRDPAGAWHATLNLHVTNEGDSTLHKGWTLSLDTKGVDGVEEAWNWRVARENDGTLEGQAEERWQELHPGESAAVGATLRLAEGKLEVTAARVNGLACALD